MSCAGGASQFFWQVHPSFPFSPRGKSNSQCQNTREGDRCDKPSIYSALAVHTHSMYIVHTSVLCNVYTDGTLVKPTHSNVKFGGETIAEADAITCHLSPTTGAATTGEQSSLMCLSFFFLCPPPLGPVVPHCSSCPAVFLLRHMCSTDVPRELGQLAKPK